MNDILVISLFKYVNKVNKVLGLTIFLAERLELLSSETVILSWRFFFSATPWT